MTSEHDEIAVDPKTQPPSWVRDPDTFSEAGSLFCTNGYGDPFYRPVYWIRGVGCFVLCSMGRGFKEWREYGYGDYEPWTSHSNDRAKRIARRALRRHLNRMRVSHGWRA